MIEEDTKTGTFRRRKFDFPALYVQEEQIYFNAYCRDLFKTKRVRVSKTADHLIFRDSSSNDSYKVRRRKGENSFLISGVGIRNITGILPGTCFKLFRTADGGYAIKLHEPLNMGVDLNG